jgi:hypothetical protein
MLALKHLYSYWDQRDRLRLSKRKSIVRRSTTLCIAASCEDQDRKEPCIDRAVNLLKHRVIDIHPENILYSV